MQDDSAIDRIASQNQVFLDRYIIKKYLTDKKYRSAMADNLNDDIFIDQDCKNVVKYVGEFVKDNSRNPQDARELAIWLASHQKPVQHIETFKDIVRQKYDIDEKFMLKNVETFVRMRMTQSVFQEQARLFVDNKIEDMGKIIGKLQKAVNFKIENSRGLEIAGNMDDFYERITASTSTIPSFMSNINRLCDGGYQLKTLNLWSGSPGTGKTMFLCNEAINSYMNGFNVVYMTCEMSEEQIMKRLVSHELHIPINELRDTPKSRFDDFRLKLETEHSNKLIVRECPTGSLTCSSIRHMLDDYKSYSGVSTDVLVVDYLNLMKDMNASQRGDSSYENIKHISQDLRAIAIDYNIPIITATHLNKSGENMLDIGMSNTSESYALPAIVDVYVGIMQDQALYELGMYKLKLLKNRSGNKNEVMYASINYREAMIRDSLQSEVERFQENSIATGMTIER